MTNEARMEFVREQVKKITDWNRGQARASSEEDVVRTIVTRWEADIDDECAKTA